MIKLLSDDLRMLNFKVERSKATIDKIKVPVLFSIDNRIDKFFETNTLTLTGLRFINEIGFKVPDDIAIVCFDGNEAFDFFIRH